MSEKNCPICNTEWIGVQKTCQSHPYVGKKLFIRHCNSCGFTQPVHAELLNDDVSDEASKRLDTDLRNLRNSTDDRPGREYHMAALGHEIQSSCGHTPKSLTFFGAGINKDHRWVQEKYKNINIKLVDLANYQNHPNFESISETSKSSLVIACEVIEHFYDPIKHFENLFNIVEDDGLIICSTNINDGSNIENHNYPFIYGHTAYWSPLALISVAARFGFNADFRNPKLCFSKQWVRKRYVFFYRNMRTHMSIAEYFGRRLFAPSE